MSAGSVVADAEEEAAEPVHRPGRRPRRSVAELIAPLLARDVFGIRLGVILLIFPILLAQLGMQLVSRQMWNHPPDSRYYLPMMSRDMGYSWAHSIHLEQQVSPSWHVAGWYFANDDPTWQMVRIRVMYPVLSLPFIWLWGLSGGSMAIPVLGTVLFLWAVARTVQRLYGPVIAVIVAGAFSVTVTITEFAWAGTDTLAMGLAAVLVLNLPIERRIGKVNLVWLGAAAVFIALTRQVGVLAPAMAGAGWVWALARERTWRNRWLGSLVVTASTTLAIQALSMTVAKADTAGAISRGQTTYWGIFRQFVHYLWIVTQEACTYMWHTDRLLYALFIAAGISVLVRYASDATAVFVGASASAYIISAGVGFSAYMRYEMIIFPAAAVGAGQLVQLVLGDRALPGGHPLPGGPVEAADVPPEARTARSRLSGVLAAVAATSPGRWLGLDQPRQDRWRPHLALNVVALAIIAGISLHGSWNSAADAPASPSYAAAQGGHDYASRPLAKPSAEYTLQAAFDQAIGLAHDSGKLEVGTLDWAHAVRYRPTSPDEPGWSTRDKDGTVVVRPTALSEDRDMQEAFGRGLSLDTTVKSGTIKILSRQVSAYGQDVVFTVQDTSGGVHRGTATTLYPIWSKSDPGTVTSLVFDS
jgi:hypothetical protein